LVAGRIIIWMAMGSIAGKMAETMKGHIPKIKNMDMGYIPGLMVRNTMGNGQKEYKMGMGTTSIPRTKK